LYILGVLSNTIPIITESFPNLVELNINGDDSTAALIDDRSLQAICQNLKKLRSLVLGACSRITDYGVTGIRREYCKYSNFKIIHIYCLLSYFCTLQLCISLFQTCQLINIIFFAYCCRWETVQIQINLSRA